MAIIVCSECGKEFSDKAPACPNCGCPTEESKMTAVVVQKETVAIVHENEAEKQDAIKHLKYANSLEQAIYTCQEAMYKIEAQMNKLGHKKHFSKPTEKKFNGIAFIGFLISFGLFLLSVGGLYEINELYLPLLLWVFCLGFLSFFLIMYELILHKNYRKVWKKYRKDVMDDQERVERESEQKVILEKQWHFLKQNLTEHKALLKKLYSVDVLFPKYRNMIAVSTILEYFESGICDKFTGADGAYSRYENDVKLGTIIDRLDAVIINLQQIRKAQYLLYQAIEESNAIAEEISYQAGRIAEINGQISENTKLIAYNTERAAFNTSVSAYIDTFY